MAMESSSKHLRKQHAEAQSVGGEPSAAGLSTGGAPASDAPPSSPLTAVAANDEFSISPHAADVPDLAPHANDVPPLSSFANEAFPLSPFATDVSDQTPSAADVPNQTPSAADVPHLARSANEGPQQLSPGIDVPLLASERIDDLLTHDLRIIQSDEVFAFSLDAVLLARFCTVPPRGRVIDLCSGNGVIPLLLTTRTAAHMRAVEIQPRLADMAARSVRMNRLDERIAVLCGDLRDLPRDIGFGGYDLVTVNPPYLPVPAGDQNVNEHVAAARHELHARLEDVVQAASRLAKSGGRVAMVHRPHRLVDICTLMRQYRIEPKRIRFVHPRAGDEANMVLVEGLRDGKPELRTLPPLIVYKNKSAYTDELQRIFYG